MDWNRCGSTVVLGVALYKEKVNWRGILFISLIIIGAVGLGLVRPDKVVLGLGF
jgi:multidrug transporter EmrE-like cation transporter